MSALTYDISYDETRSRLTNAFRIILAIPHVIVMTVWGYLAEILAFIQWFIIVFTGKRNQAMWDLQWAWLGYAGRVQGYTNLMFDPYPAFGTAPGPVPVSIDIGYDDPADRLTNGLRFIWAIPAIIIGLGISIAFSVVVLIAWFAIVITGKHPRGLFDFGLKSLRYLLRLNTYVLLMTDTYPKWESGPARAASPDYVTPPPGLGSGSAPLAPPTPQPTAQPPAGGQLPPPG